MSFSLYGALPPSKSSKSNNSDTKPDVSVPKEGGLYSSLPIPESISIAESNAQTTEKKSSVPSEQEPVAKQTGWSTLTNFRPVMRRPNIQAKAKLNKPFIPAGATVVSTKTIKKEDKEKQEQLEAEAARVASEQKKNNDNIDLGAIPLLTTADDVNGFNAIQKSSKKKRKAAPAPQPVVFNMLEDYDPHRPNDYEQYKEERSEMKERQKRKREWAKQNEASPDRWSGSRSKSRSRSVSRSRSRSISPEGVQLPELERPSVVKIDVNETAEDAYLRRMRMSQQQPESQSTSPPQSLAQDPMHISQQTARQLAQKYTEEQHSRQQIASPTKVILLLNMVGPGEVDDVLQEETAEECSKYGKVERCLVFEVPRGKVSDDRAVRIFVQFAGIESAQKAVQDLNGRFFGGRVVVATFFDPVRFEKLDLAPSREELHS